MINRNSAIMQNKYLTIFSRQRFIENLKMFYLFTKYTKWILQNIGPYFYTYNIILACMNYMFSIQCLIMKDNYLYGFHMKIMEMKNRAKSIDYIVTINIFSRTPIFLLKSWQEKHTNYVQFLRNNTNQWG